MEASALQQCSARSSSLSSLTPPRRGGALRPLSTDSVSMLFCVGLPDQTCGHRLGCLTRRRLRTSATQLMKNCSSKLELFPTTFYTHSSHHHLLHLRAIVLDTVNIHSCYLNALLISLTVISLCVCYTRTPARPSHRSSFYLVQFLCMSEGRQNSCSDKSAHRKSNRNRCKRFF